MNEHRQYLSALKLIITILIISISFLVYGQGELLAPRLDLAYFQTDAESPYITVRVRKRVERRFEPMQGVPVNVYFNEESDESIIGNIITNDKGEGKVNLPESFYEAWSKLNEFEFIGVISASDTVEETTESISVKRARISIEAEESDEIRLFKIKVEEKSDDEWLPVEDAEVKAFVKRHFGRLIVGDDYYMSDVDGLVEIEFDQEYPGDLEGMITLGGIIEDHEEYGNIITYHNVKWGVPINDEVFKSRSLWSTRNKAPLWLLIFPNLIILGVWIVIAYLAWTIVKIKRLARSKD